MIVNKDMMVKELEKAKVDTSKLCLSNLQHQQVGPWHFAIFLAPCLFPETATAAVMQLCLTFLVPNRVGWIHILDFLQASSCRCRAVERQEALLQELYLSVLNSKRGRLTLYSTLRARVLELSVTLK